MCCGKTLSEVQLLDLSLSLCPAPPTEVEVFLAELCCSNATSRSATPRPWPMALPSATQQGQGFFNPSCTAEKHPFGVQLLDLGLSLYPALPTRVEAFLAELCCAKATSRPRPIALPCATDQGRGFFTRAVLRGNILSECNSSTSVYRFLQRYPPRSRLFWPSYAARKQHLGVQLLDPFRLNSSYLPPASTRPKTSSQIR